MAPEKIGEIITKLILPPWTLWMPVMSATTLARAYVQDGDVMVPKTENFFLIYRGIDVGGVDKPAPSNE